MRPKLILLSDELVKQIIEEGFALLMNPGIQVHNDEALSLLADAGAEVDMESKIAKIPEKITRQALDTRPSEFYLYDLDGNQVVHYGGDSVQFDPGSEVSQFWIVKPKSSARRLPRITSNLSSSWKCFPKWMHKAPPSSPLMYLKGSAIFTAFIWR